jgi:hypothetical protein
MRSPSCVHGWRNLLESKSLAPSSEIFAVLATLFGEWRRAAQLYGAANAQLEQIEFQREPADEAFLTPLMAQAREALGSGGVRGGGGGGAGAVLRHGNGGGGCVAGGNQDDTSWRLGGSFAQRAQTVERAQPERTLERPPAYEASNRL